MKKKTKQSQNLPKGWTQREIDDLITHYDHQTDEEGAAEIDAGGEEDQALVEVPWNLLPRIRKMIAENRKRKGRTKPGRRVA